MKNRHQDYKRRGRKIQENALKHGVRGAIQPGAYEK